MIFLKWAHNVIVPPYISSIKEAQVPDEPVPRMFALDLLTIPGKQLNQCPFFTRVIML